MAMPCTDVRLERRAFLVLAGGAFVTVVAVALAVPFVCLLCRDQFFVYMI